MRIWNKHTLQPLTVEKFVEVVNKILSGEAYYKQSDGFVINRQYQRKLM